MLHTNNSIVINAAPGTIYDLAAGIERWPRLLSHYRYVRIVEGRPPSGMPGQQRLTKMAASRSGLPVSWTSVQSLEPHDFKVLYRHVAGVTRGMDVLWTIEPREDGRCLVSISHDLDRPEGLLRLPFARWVAGRFFVRAIADQTLEGVKREAESRTASESRC